MKKVVVVVLIIMTCLGMSGITTSVTKSVEQHDGRLVSQQKTRIEQPSSSTMDQLKQSVYSYLAMEENPYGIPQGTLDQSVTVPWMKPAGNLFQWWIRVKYGSESFEQQLDVSIFDFKQKFLKHPYYSEDVFFNVDDDPENDLKVSFGFYWESILNTKTNKEHKSLEDMVRVRQINSGPSDLYAGLEVWSEIHVSWGLVNAYSVSNEYSSTQTQYNLPQQMISPFLGRCGMLLNLFQQKLQHLTQISSGILFSLLSPQFLTSERESMQAGLLQNPRRLAAENDYISVGVGYRTLPGEPIPQYVEKRFAFAKENIFSPVIFQQVMRTEPSGVDPLELLYGFRAYNGSTNTLKYDIAFCVQFTPFVTLTTQFIPLGGYVYYHFDSASQHASATTITYSTDIAVGAGDGVSLSLVFDEIDDSMVQPGRWMSFGLRRDPHGFSYEANAIFDVAVIVDSPWFSQKVRIQGLPKSLSYEWKIFDDFEVVVVQGELFYVNVRGYADVTMSSPLDELIVYYPKLNESNAVDAPFLQVNNIPSSRRLEAKATLNIQNSSMLRIDTDGYVDLTKSGPMGDITVFYPKADPLDPNLVLLKVPAGTVNSQRVSAEATLYVDADNFSNLNNYVYGKIQRQANSNFHELDLYLPNVAVPLVQITDIPANAYATGTFWWNQLKGFGRAERSAASQTPDPVHFNLVFDTLTLSDVFSIGDGHVQTDFLIAEDGYFTFDTSHDILGNLFSVGNSATGNALTIGASTVSAKDFQAAWGLNTTGPEPKIERLALSGDLNALNDVVVSISLDGEVVDFTGDWSLGESGGFSIDVEQNADLRIDFLHLDNVSGRLDLNGYVILSQNLHYDMGWQWKQGTSLEDPGFFKINEGTNDPNLKEIGLKFLYKDESSVDRWGVNLTLVNFAVYISVEWYWQSGFHIWRVIQVSGLLNLNVLLNYNWYHVWP